MEVEEEVEEVVEEVEAEEVEVEVEEVRVLSPKPKFYHLLIQFF